jgi:hypothetical protein
VGQRNGTTNLKMADAEALAKTERAILTFVRRERPESLQDLRAGLAKEPVSVDERFVNLAILQLLNTRRLGLSADRRLRVNG